jgi:hypothetical protein
MIRFIPPAALAALALTACAPPGATGSQTPPLSFADAFAASTEAFGEAVFANEGATTTNVGNMPTSGDATYSGYASVILQKDTPAGDRYDMLIGSASLTAAFTAGSGTVTGEARDFTYANDLTTTEFQARSSAAATLAATAASPADYTDVGRALYDSQDKAVGSVAITDGVIAGPGASATASGSIEHGPYTTTVEGPVAGGFVGATGEGLRLVTVSPSSIEQGDTPFLGSQFLVLTRRD